MLVFTAGCDQENTSGSPQEEVVIKPLATFPLSRRILLGEFQAQVKSLLSIPVSSPADGDIVLHVSSSRTKLEQGVLWGEIGSEQLASEEQALELTIQSERLRIREELQTVNRELARVEHILSDPVLRDLGYREREPVSTNLLHQLRSEQLLLREQLEACGEADRLKLQQKSLRSRLVMPFDGELLVYLPVSGQRRQFRVAANTPIGVMRDVSELYLHIVVRDPQIVAIPTHQLTVEFKRDSGESYLGAFNDAQVAELQGQDVLIYRFSFTPEIIPELMPLIGANLTCMLWAESDTEFHTVAKLELARMLGGNSAFPGWDEAVCSLWPSARLLYSGHANLGIAMEADDE